MTKNLDILILDKEIVETEKNVIPVKPLLVVEINYLEMTKNNKLRAPVFIRLRDDKEAKDCML